MADRPSTVPQSSAPEGTAATTNAHIPELPNEVLCSIAGFVNDADIPNLRLAAKVFHYITAERFATVFFQDRAYNLSPAGLKALVKITEHPVFAPHIRTIIIGHGGKHHSAKYHDKMESAFRNLKLYGHKISLGLRRVRTAHNFEVGPIAVAYTMILFSAKMIFAAKKAQMPIENFIADLQNPLVGEHTGEWCSLYPHSIPQRYGITAFHIKLPSHGSNFAASGCVSFNYSHRRLELSKTSLSINTVIPMSLWDLAEELRLSDCEVSGVLMANLLTQSSQLKHMAFHNVHLATSSDDLAWKWVFAYLSMSRTTLLKSCEFGNLWHGKNSLWLEGGSKSIRANTQAQVITVLSNLAAGRIRFSLDD